jgi:hypothetical protein
MTNDTPGSRRTAGRLPFMIGLCLFLAIAAFFLWTEHRAHLFGALPYLILLACPLIHIFMHRGHGHGDSSHGSHADHPPAHGGNR